ncbi:MAG: hypothetical protein AB198_00520 [Parcubacteria bacterium C7867-003]|nr:MAG: hypothetical protein AB198_00520 [Parcubacteria bacterium C7867-003]
MLDKIEKITTESFVSGFIFLISFIGPSTALVYYFKNDVFVNVDISKLLLLSVSFFTPFLLINFSIIMLSSDRPSNNERELFDLTMLSVLISSFVCYLAIFICYLFDFNFERFIYLAIFIEILFLFYNSKIKKI